MSSSPSASTSTDSSDSLESVFQRLPPELLERIIGSMNYEHVAMTRLVCQRFNRTCQSILNQGFCKVDRLHTSSTKWVKSHLPRRESERRSHPLARHCDILSGIETRLSLLSMTYTKYIETGASCFIPGKVLDEVVRILSLVQGSAKATLEGHTSNLPRAHELLQELRDISSMAMEHFDEKIVPIIRYRAQQQPNCGSNNPMSSPSRSYGALDMPIYRGKMSTSSLVAVAPSGGHQSPSASLHDLFPPSSPSASGSSPTIGCSSAVVTSANHVPVSEFIQLKKKISTMKRKSDESQKSQEETVAQQNSLIQSQNHTIQSQSQKISRLERRLDRLAKKFLDCSAKVEDILRCGQTGIKLKRKGDVDVALLSGDESETSANPSPKGGGVDDEIDDDEDDDDAAEEDSVAHGDDGEEEEEEDDDEGETREDGDDEAVKVDLAALAKDYESVKVTDESKYSPPRPSPSSLSSLVGVRVLKRSPIKLRLRQTAPAAGSSNAAANDGDADERISSSGNIGRYVHDGGKCPQAKKEKTEEEAEEGMGRGKGGKSSASSKRKGKSATSTTAAAGAKRKKAEKEEVGAEPNNKDADVPPVTSSSSMTQRKRQKL